jgi:hypothetical protein
MMVFREIRDAIRRVLAQNSDGEFNVIGAQKRGKGAAEVADRSRLVEVYYSRGDFPKSGAPLLGPTKHDMTFRIDLTVSKSSEGDVDTILDPGASAAEVARAIEAMKESELAADESLDELFENIYQILMDSRNVDFGLEIGTVGSRWVSAMNKDEPVEMGNYSILTGSCLLTCTTSEPVPGYVGIQAGNIADTTVEVETDLPGRAGVETGA